MINLIRTDIYRMFKSKAIYIFIILCIAFAVAMPCIFDFARDQLANMPDVKNAMESMNMNEGQSFGFSVGMDSNALLDQQTDLNAFWFVAQIFGGNILILFVAILASLFVTSEYSYGTIKNLVAKGFSRISIYMSKLITVWIAILIMQLVLVVITFITSAIIFGTGAITSEIIIQVLGMILIQLLLHMAIGSICTMVAMNLKHSAGTMALNIIMITMTSSIIGLIDILLPEGMKISDYLITTNISKMAVLDAENIAVIKSIGVAVIYTIASTAIGTVIFRKLDI